MRKILKIAGTELATMFYSPIAWLLLVLFAFQAAMAYTNLYGQLVWQLSMNTPGSQSVTRILFAGGGGVFEAVRSNLYLYIPLLTMGLMSREFSSGSIKLLYSSPVTNLQIVFGKYLSVMTYGLCLTGVLVILVICSALTIPQADVSSAFPGLLGMYLLICGYAAIGLFMSCLTSYQIIAAVGTLGVLTALNYIGGIGNDLPFLQDVTYWLSMAGRTDDFILGLMPSSDVFYYGIVVVFFLTLSVMRLYFVRHRQTVWKRMGSYAGVCVVAMLLGYITSRPLFTVYWDATSNEAMTISEDSQKILEQLKGPLKIITYVNLLGDYYAEGLPAKKNEDIGRFEMYLRFKPRINFDYVYYYHETQQNKIPEEDAGLTPGERAEKIAKNNHLNFKQVLSPEEIDRIIDLSPEGYRLVRLLEADNGRKTFLRVYDDGNRFPYEAEITAALKRLTLDVPPQVGIVYGHGERAIDKKGDGDYSVFSVSRSSRYALVNQGFDVEKVTLSGEVPGEVSILVIADPKSSLSTDDQAHLEAYLARGGNLLIAGEPERQEITGNITNLLGVRFLPGTLVQMTKDYNPLLVTCSVTKEMAEIEPEMRYLQRRSRIITLPGTVALEYDTTRGYRVTPLLATLSDDCWNELQTIDFTDQQPQLQATTGEEQGIFVTAVDLSRYIGDREQRIIVLGDADWMSNSELTIHRPGLGSYNYNLVLEIFHRLSDGQFPCEARSQVARDNSSVLTTYSMQWITAGLMGGLPLLLALAGGIIWTRRKRG